MPTDVFLNREGWTVEHVDDPATRVSEYGEHSEFRNHKDGVAIKPENVILINEDLPGPDRLEMEIHEMLHVLDWDRPEDQIHARAEELAAALWRLGWRPRKRVRQ
ncbi:MAG TPA: hypothetical protein VFD92_04705 [Candidatus Binatia bacterium]|nr:hypothetical protein [Candidatus Binatia bacterium]